MDTILSVGTAHDLEERENLNSPFVGFFKLTSQSADSSSSVEMILVPHYLLICLLPAVSVEMSMRAGEKHSVTYVGTTVSVRCNENLSFRSASTDHIVFSSSHL